MNFLWCTLYICVCASTEMFYGAPCVCASTEMNVLWCTLCVCQYGDECFMVHPVFVCVPVRRWMFYDAPCVCVCASTEMNVLWCTLCVCQYWDEHPRTSSWVGSSSVCEAHWHGRGRVAGSHQLPLPDIQRLSAKWRGVRRWTHDGAWLWRLPHWQQCRVWLVLRQLHPGTQTGNNVLSTSLSCGLLSYMCLDSPLPSNRQHLSCGDCLEGKRGDYLTSSVLLCIIIVHIICTPI